MDGISPFKGHFTRALIALAAVSLCSCSRTGDAAPVAAADSVPVAAVDSAPAATADSVAPAAQTAAKTHKQKAIVTVATSKDGSKLEDFCTDASGRILALLGPAGPGEGGDGSLLGGALRFLKGASPAAPKFESAVHVFNTKGELLQKWPVGFSGQAINTAPDGTILVGGDGRIARFDSEGKKLLEEESPQMTYIKQNPDEMRERAHEQLETDRAMYTERIQEFEDQLKEVAESKKEKKNDKETEDESFELDEGSLKPILAAYREQLKRLEKKTVDEALKEVTSRAQRINAICAGEGDVFVTCPAMQGYGYGVWRTDDKFGNAKEIVKSLSGCCGQMDVQCCNGELYVCENSKHRVVRFNRDGKQIGEFGKRDRDGEGESFGGCCNPMNLCFNKGGDLYVSESNGVVKRFTPAGKYMGVVGVADVQPGCKNSCVAATADDSHVFFIDIYKSQIIVLARE